MSILQSTTHHSNVKDFTLQSHSLEDCTVGVGLFTIQGVIMTIASTHAHTHVTTRDETILQYRAGGTGPAGLALAGPKFRYFKN